MLFFLALIILAADFGGDMRLGVLWPAVAVVLSLLHVSLKREQRKEERDALRVEDLPSVLETEGNDRAALHALSEQLVVMTVALNTYLSKWSVDDEER